MEMDEKSQKPIRVLLIQPSAQKGVHSLLAQVDEDSTSIGAKPPLGLLYLASTLKQQTSHEIKIIDALTLHLDPDEILKEAIRYQPHIIGISAWTDFWYPAFSLGRILKKHLPNTFLVYGGPHVSIYYRETLEFPFVDAVIAGDGEIPLINLSQMVTNNSFHNNIPGLHLKQYGPKKTEPIYIQKDLDSLPIPDRTLVPINLYGSILSKTGQSTTMITSRGCPWKCVFCKLSFQKTLSRSAENILEEFRQIRELGIKEVEIYDDTFSWSRKRVSEICSHLIKDNNTVKWSIRDRVNRADPKLLELMFKAGCRRIHYGIESGVDRVLEDIGKRITIEEARNAVRWAKDAGMTVLTYFMFGLPGETVEDMKETVNFALELDSDYCEFSITIPYPATEMYHTALKNRLISSDYWQEYARNPAPDFCPPQLIEEFADQEKLISIQKKAIRRFYFRPKYLTKQLLTLKSINEFRQKANMGIKLFLNSFKSS